MQESSRIWKAAPEERVTERWKRLPCWWPVVLAVALMVSADGSPVNPVAAQGLSTPAQPGSRGVAFEGALIQNPRTNGRAVLQRNVKSVLGIEVRSSHEKNIGRIVDLLADRSSGGVEAAVVEFGGFLGIGARRIAIAWSDLRFESDGKQLVAVLDIPRDQLRAAADYKSGEPTIVTKVTEPLMPSTQEPPKTVTQAPGPPQEKSARMRTQRHRLY
jgi:hypothetical protein